ncbi:aldo/keto reductase [Lactococcus garvieae]|uniref:Oxidoreductase of aldo/keto reductase family, subgroup 1 n=1 Tax=Lactococcus garvieae DCC43 TaxID=1231377 RepID=K2PUQ9_9LACT|nr:aldo/keto reductase [Lactococcus garvieae]EKF51161.1 oxidoreductase of aldo/keto reductase family, subgroup 1 [Lactococcus garvieae DCC43]
MLTDTYELINGVKIPKLGFGTWLLDNEQAARAVKEALQAGYRHIDTAEAYENEAGVGRGIRESGIARDEIFVTTKLHAEIKDYDQAKLAIAESLEKLGLDSIDLMIIHSPKPWNDFLGKERYFEGNLAAWKALEEAYEEGKLKAIGVSNFETIDLENLINHGKIPPMVNQVLAHIGNIPSEVIEYSKKHDVLVEAYSPFGHGDMFKHEALKEIADKYGVSVAQLAVRYLLQLGLLPLPKASSLDHVRNNADVDFIIGDSDIKRLDNFTKIEYSKENKVFPVYQK